MQQIIYIIASSLLLIGTVMGIADLQLAYAPYILGIGALGIIYLALQAIRTDQQTDKRTSRLHRINLFASLLLLLAAYLMYEGSNSWVVAVFIYALNVLVLSFRGKQS